jgi:hypothetical protein
MPKENGSRSSRASPATSATASLCLGESERGERESGLNLDSPTGWVCAVRDGKLLKAQGFLRKTDALEAAGVSQ